LFFSYVPNLRFENYSNSYIKNKLGVVVFLRKGKYNPLKEKQDFPCIELESIEQDSCRMLEIFKAKNQKSIKTKFFKGDVLFGKLRPYLRKFLFSNFNGVCSTEIWALHSSAMLNSYLFYYLQTEYFMKIASTSSGTKMPRAEWSLVSNADIKYPDSIEEMTKISTMLGLIDKRIESQNKIIEDLIIKKKIISDKLFSQIPMHRNTLSSFYEKGRAGGTPKSTNKKYYAGEIPFLSISDMTEQGKYIYWTQKTLTQEGLENSTAWIVPKDSLVLSMYASVGQVAINKIPLTTSQAIFSMTITDKVILDFLYYYLSYFKEKKLHRYLETGTQSNINADFIKGIAIPDYGYYKNKLIISLLSLMDEKIKKEKDILSLYKKQKSYLLQNMFI